MSKYNHGRIRVPKDPDRKPSLLAIGILLIVAPPVTTFIGLYLGYKRLQAEWTRKRYQTYRRYANIIGDRATVSIRGLAAEMGMSTANVASDLQAMIDEGIIPGNAYIDRSHMTLHMETAQGDAVETNFVDSVVDSVINVFMSPEDRAQTVAEAKAAQAKKARPVEEAAPKQEAPAPKPKTGTENEDFEAKLREIRQLNDEIEDSGVSDRIDRIGELTASIFRVVREKPEHAEEVRKFMNYYLPTTLKLLKSYSLMEKQSYQGENIQASRKKIEDVLDTLIHAFEQQQDRLFKTEALDVETDISVLETMMASDGLLEQKSGLRAGGGH